MRYLCLVLAASAGVAPAVAQEQEQEEASADILYWVDGNWKIVGEDGIDIQTCQKAQTFSLSKDRANIVLTEQWADFAATYRIVRIEEDRVLTMIEGEERTTEQGDPVLWWLHFRNRDNFSFRQYGWDRNSVTMAQWVRCPA